MNSINVASKVSHLFTALLAQQKLYVKSLKSPNLMCVCVCVIIEFVSEVFGSQ